MLQLHFIVLLIIAILILHSVLGSHRGAFMNVIRMQRKAGWLTIYYNTRACQPFSDLSMPGRWYSFLKMDLQYNLPLLPKGTWLDKKIFIGNSAPKLRHGAHHSVKVCCLCDLFFFLNDTQTACSTALCSENRWLCKGVTFTTLIMPVML